MHGKSIKIKWQRKISESRDEANIRSLYYTVTKEGLALLRGGRCQNLLDDPRTKMPDKRSSKMSGAVSSIPWQ